MAKSLTHTYYQSFCPISLSLYVAHICCLLQVKISSGIEEVSSEDIGMDMQEDNVIDSNESNLLADKIAGISDEFDPGEGTSSGSKSRSRTSQWRDQKRILDAANNDPVAISKAHQAVLPPDASYVAKRISDDPNLGGPLRKYIKKLDRDLEKMNDELWRNEDGENVSPISCLAYMLGIFTCHVQNYKINIIFMKLTLAEVICFCDLNSDPVLKQFGKRLFFISQ